MLRTAFVLSVALLSACSMHPHAAPPPPNTLTAAERADGTQLLFDGTSTASWRGYKQADLPAGWKVVDGALTRVSEAGDIVTREEYQDFVLDFE